MNSLKEVLLTDLEVLVFDCQATSSAPGKGDLLEIGWLRTRASHAGSGSNDISSHLIRLPEGTEISRPVKRITGICETDLAGALRPRKAWKKLIHAAKKIPSTGKDNLRPMVIHYSRFEEPYLRLLQQKWMPTRLFPFEIFCTHQILKILVPQLPRKGLRAAAGYFGHSVPELRRSASHVAATVFVWGQVVALLAESRGVRTLPELRDWLKNNKQQVTLRSRSRVYPMKTQFRKGLPDQPGVYRMLRCNGDLLYIGKAKSLKQRVNSYFQKSTPHGERTLEMLTQAKRLDFTVTGSALEAALLESDEIKGHTPPYNVALRRGDREIVFFSTDMGSVSTIADEAHPIGPLPAKESLSAFSAVAALLQGQYANVFDGDSPALILNLPPEYAPGADCFIQGVEIFKQRHRPAPEIAGQKPFINGLLRLGKQLRRQKLEELARAETEEEEDLVDETGPNEDKEEERVWTPEAVAAVIEGIIRHGSHLLRRSRWFNLLSESSIEWQEVIGKEARNIRLVFERGTIVSRGEFAVAEECDLPVPPGHDRRFSERRRSFDLFTYDRLRVLTTELRRIVADPGGSGVQLRLSPKVILRQAELLELLKWV